MCEESAQRHAFHEREQTYADTGDDQFRNIVTRHGQTDLVYEYLWGARTQQQFTRPLSTIAVLQEDATRRYFAEQRV
ncbi:unnamed protein product [Toxocara canis]|uniref:SAM-dependent methyltransferase n=1 Tax=Toxocara canis TaxID=6265 RepID=A0A183UMB1_TOXCA|nr:unnamed protein product [Toxocara canis]